MNRRKFLGLIPAIPVVSAAVAKTVVKSSIVSSEILSTGFVSLQDCVYGEALPLNVSESVYTHTMPTLTPFKSNLKLLKSVCDTSSLEDTGSSVSPAEEVDFQDIWPL